jgi:uncharacterized protein YaeQ
VSVYAYGASAELWWKPIAERLARAKNLAVWRVPAAESQALGTLAGRAMQLQCTVQEGQVWFSDAEETVQMELDVLKAAEG